MNNRKIGILGGGQLGKMLYQSASTLHADVLIMEKDPACPAAGICPGFVLGDITRYEDVVSFGEKVDVITIEIENVNIEALEFLEKSGKRVYPQPSVIKLIKDKGLQKMFYEGFKIPTADFMLFSDAEEILQAVNAGTIRLPFVQKTRKDGYDGRGVQVVRTEADLGRLFNAPSVVESLVDIQAELAVIVSRGEHGEHRVFPPVQMQFHPTANLVEFLFSPSDLNKKILDKATALALEVAERMDIIGLLAVEMFADQHGNVLVNEVAPRPHNSGHHTIEANYTSQYDQLLRCLLGLPLGSTEAHHAAAMVNLLGEDGFEGRTRYEGLDDAFSKEGVYVHLYGKKTTKPFRKMGHVTVIGSDIMSVKETAEHIFQTVKVKA